MQSGVDQLRDWMRRRGFTQADAARYLGWTEPYLSTLLSTRRSPRLMTAIHIERLTGIPVEAWMATDLDVSVQGESEEAEIDKLAKR